MKKLLLILTIIGSEISLYSQNFTPVVTVYGRSEHHCDHQVWSATCGPDGSMFFGNGKGILNFDGIAWHLEGLPGGKIARTVFNDEGRLYVGSFEEFGYFVQDPTGQPQYVSLADKLKDYRMDNDEIWTILRSGDEILFHSFTSYFTFNPTTGEVAGHRVPAFVESIGKSSDGKILTSYDGLSELNIETGELTTLPHPFKGRMVAAIPTLGRTIIVTLNEGIYFYDGKQLRRFRTDSDQILLNTNVNRAMVDDHGHLIIGTTRDGCIALDRDGRQLWHISADDALRSNTILGISSDKEGNIWLACDSGIAKVDDNSGIRYVQELKPHTGALYTVYYDGSTIYMGSNQGLYSAKYDENANAITNIRRYSQINGFVWTVTGKEGQIFCGTNTGTYEMAGGQPRKIEGVPDGGSCFSEGVIGGKRVMVEGTYVGIAVYTRKGGRWVFSNMIDDFHQPISLIDIDFRGNIWAAHNQEGMYRISLDSDLRTMSACERIESLTEGGEPHLIRIFDISGRTVFMDGSHICTYDDINSTIIPYSELETALSKLTGAVSVCQYDADRYWFMTQEFASLVTIRQDSVKVSAPIPYDVFMSNSVDRLQEIQPGPGKMSIMTLDNSIAFIPESYDTGNAAESRISIQGITLSSRDGKHTVKVPLDGKNYSWSYNYRLIHLQFTCPRFSAPGDTRYEYNLSGRDKVWTSIGSNDALDLNYLSEGRYSLCLRAVTAQGTVIDETKVEFTIRPPFHKSTLAWILYSLIIITIIIYVIHTQRVKLRAEKKDIENERLANEIEMKSREATASAMSLISKNKMLQDIKQELTDLGSQMPDKYYRKMADAIDSQLSSEQDWTSFEKNFDMVHSGFTKTLKERYPTLTHTDLRFCSFFCMNLSSKEIASIMNISLKGVEAARYRIRKKIGLDSKISLAEFLMEL